MAAPDGRQLPEWVDFEWQEPAYPGIERQSGQSYKEWSDLVDAKYRALPVKKQRVLIRSRVPQDVVDEVLESRRNKLPGKLPEKQLDLYLIWTPQGIKFHWKIWQIAADGRQTYPREGGDNIELSEVVS